MAGLRVSMDVPRPELCGAVDMDGKVWWVSHPHHRFRCQRTIRDEPDDPDTMGFPMSVHIGLNAIYIPGIVPGVCWARVVPLGIGSLVVRFHSIPVVLSPGSTANRVALRAAVYVAYLIVKDRGSGRRTLNGWPFPSTKYDYITRLGAYSCATDIYFS